MRAAAPASSRGLAAWLLSALVALNIFSVAVGRPMQLLKRADAPPDAIPPDVVKALEDKAGAVSDMMSKIKETTEGAGLKPAAPEGVAIPPADLKSLPFVDDKTPNKEPTAMVLQNPAELARALAAIEGFNWETTIGGVDPAEFAKTLSKEGTVAQEYANSDMMAEYQLLRNIGIESPNEYEQAAIEQGFEFMRRGRTRQSQWERFTGDIRAANERWAARFRNVWFFLLGKESGVRVERPSPPEPGQRPQAGNAGGVIVKDQGTDPEVRTDPTKDPMYEDLRAVFKGAPGSAERWRRLSEPAPPPETQSPEQKPVQHVTDQLNPPMSDEPEAEEIDPNTGKPKLKKPRPGSHRGGGRGRG